MEIISYQTIYISIKSKMLCYLFNNNIFEKSNNTKHSSVENKKTFAHQHKWYLKCSGYTMRYPYISRCMNTI